MKFRPYFADILMIIIPPANCVCGRVYCFHVVRPSERPTVRMCVRIVLFPEYLGESLMDILKFCKHIYMYKENTTDRKLGARGQYYWSYFPL